MIRSVLKLKSEDFKWFRDKATQKEVRERAEVSFN